MKKVRSKSRPTEIGVIKTFGLSPSDEIGEIAVECTGCTYYYNNLTELCDKWEDYEEPDLFYYIDADGYINFHLVNDGDFNNVKDGVENLIAIGNYFETREEAEKAVEKLKARTRLINHGFCLKLNRFQERIEYKFKTGKISSEYDAEEALKDIGLLFGGEE